MMPQPHACPFCLSRTLRLLANFHDTLTAYHCETCRQVFYTVELRFAAAQPIVEPLQQRGTAALSAVRRAGGEAVAPVAVVGRKLSFGRRLRRP